MARAKKASARAESVQLIRGSPRTEVVRAKARWGAIRRFKPYRGAIIEMRDSALLVYPLSTSPGASEEEIDKFISTASSRCIEVVPLREARLTVNSKKRNICIQKPDLSGSIDIRFSGVESFNSWKDQLTELSRLRSVTLADFEVDRHVGKGASGRVYLVKDKVTEEDLALKVIEKSTVFESSDSYRHALDERIVIEMASNHPFILDMRYSFQNSQRLFLVTEYCGGGDLFEYLNRRSRPMDEAKARHVMAEILLAIEHIHSLGVVYRDLKLENVLLDVAGHIRMADFGLSKLLTEIKSASPSSASRSDPKTQMSLQKTKTFCGTREYVSPEMLSNAPYDTSVDLWAFGVLLYEILCGRTPFYSDERGEIYDRIEKADVWYPKDMSQNVQDLLKGLLQRDVRKRLGTGPEGIQAIKSHPWFSGIDWDDVYNMKPHAHSIAKELIQMHCGKSDKPSSSSKKSKRQEAQDDALKALQSDCANDIEAITKSTPRTPWGDSQQIPFSGKRSPRVVPATTGTKNTKSRKRSPMIAGYSFVGTLPVGNQSKAPESTDSPGVAVYRNPSDGYERENVFNATSAFTAGPQKPVEHEMPLSSATPDRTAVVDAKRLAPAFNASEVTRFSDAGIEVDVKGDASGLITPRSDFEDVVDRKVDSRFGSEYRESAAVPRANSERRESAAVPRARSTFSRPSSILRKRHQEKLFRRGDKNGG